MINELYFDGSCEPKNPGGTGKCGYVINLGLETKTGNKILGKYPWMTNNIAEWEALVLGLTECVKLNIKDLKVFGDSNLVVYGASGKWKCKAKHLIHFKKQVDLLKKNFDNIYFEWIPREENYLADELSKL